MTVSYERLPEPQTPIRQYWTKIYTKNPYCIYFFGPFPSEEEAKRTEYRYEARLQTEGKQVVACFHILPSGPDEILDSCMMSHNHWLQALMEDYLRKKVAYTREDISTVIEHHSVHDAYVH